MSFTMFHKYLKCYVGNAPHFPSTNNAQSETKNKNYRTKMKAEEEVAKNQWKTNKIGRLPIESAILGVAPSGKAINQNQNQKKIVFNASMTVKCVVFPMN